MCQLLGSAPSHKTAGSFLFGSAGENSIPNSDSDCSVFPNQPRSRANLQIQPLKAAPIYLRTKG
jgi:hypothetical protein